MALEMPLPTLGIASSASRPFVKEGADIRAEMSDGVRSSAIRTGPEWIGALRVETPGCLQQIPGDALIVREREGAVVCIRQPRRRWRCH
ncbi:hypothetical protein DM992_20500 [Burkholderia sp. JP2-270]|uniref:hypothetical protein n=1 Tax=Burkholderia sp. JP2-270 TaxID=2217913 RepID=UPI000DA35F38|nr:hypothetical protein [Burkholderia sp. JP2-270]AWV01883.1 hypothetical protein DM992_20500 [Burkholderia sp. JP2-270]